MRRCYCVQSVVRAYQALINCNMMDPVGDAGSAYEFPFVALLWLSGAHVRCRLFGCEVSGVKLFLLRCMVQRFFWRLVVDCVTSGCCAGGFSWTRLGAGASGDTCRHSAEERRLRAGEAVHLRLLQVALARPAPTAALVLIASSGGRRRERLPLGVGGGTPLCTSRTPCHEVRLSPLCNAFVATGRGAAMSALTGKHSPCLSLS